MLQKVLSVLFTAVAIFGCSNEQIYDEAQGNHRLDCQKLPQVQYEECMSQVDEDYDAYSQKRKEDRAQE